MKTFNHLLCLSLAFSFLVFSSCKDDDDLIPDSFIYLDDNGITIKATSKAVVGETYELDGESYKVVDSVMLYNMIANDEDVSAIVTSRIASMVELLKYAPDVSSNLAFNSFNQDIRSWDVSNVTDMSWLFIGARSFNQDISAWDVSNATKAMYMFVDAESFNKDISAWNFSNVTTVSGMFWGARNFNQDISTWDMSNMTDMSFMFVNATSFNQDISSWNVSDVTTMFQMFGFAESFNQDLSSWSVGSVTSCTSFSEGATSWTEPKPNFTNCTE